MDARGSCDDTRRMRCLLAFLVLASCSSGAEPRTTAAEQAPASSEPTSEPAVATVVAPAEAPPAQPAAPPAETWACSTVLHPLVDFHHARLELRADGTYELQHTHMTPQNGWSTWLQGSWSRPENGDVVIVPERALRRAWIGDMHRQDHGEDVGAMQWEEPMTTDPWRLTHRTDPQLGEALALPELRTSVYRSASTTPPACDPGPPPRRSRR